MQRKVINLIHLCQDHEDVEQDVEVAEVRVGYLVLESVEHVLDALVTAVDCLAEDEDGCEADDEGSLIVFSLFENCFEASKCNVQNRPAEI